MIRKTAILAALAALAAVVALVVPGAGRATGWQDLSSLGYGVTQTTSDPSCPYDVVISVITGYQPGAASAILGCSASPGFQAAVDAFVDATCHHPEFWRAGSTVSCAIPLPPATPPPPPTTTTTVAPAPAAPAPTTTTTTEPTAAPAPVDATVSTAPATSDATVSTGPTTADLQAQIDEIRVTIASVVDELHRLVCSLQTWGPTMDPAILATMMSLDSTCSS